MCKISLVVLLLICDYLARQTEIVVCDDVEASESDNSFNFLVFSQKWTVTFCKYWIYDLNGSECVYPNKKNRWTVHGIWPSTGRELYPEFCNTSWAYNPEEIKSIEGEMQQVWTNIYKGTDPNDFWKYEWLKHGTCATELEEFNSEFKYFRKGIDWNQKYSILDMFEAANIFPDDTKELTPEVLVNAVKAKTMKNPMVVCYTQDEGLFLKEMRLCFDKQQNLIDCDPVVDKNCDVSKGIIFPANAR